MMQDTDDTLPSGQPSDPSVVAARDRDDRTGDREIDPKLLEILVCPLTKAPLRYDREAQELISDQAGLAFPIRNGVAIMLVDEARQLSDDPLADGAAALAAPGREE